MHVLHDVWANPWRDEMIGPWNCRALVVVFDHPPVLLLLGKRHGEVATDLLVMASSRQRVVWAEIDREPGKEKPVPSDHAPLITGIDNLGHPFDAGWASADSRIASRRGTSDV